MGSLFIWQKIIGGITPGFLWCTAQTNQLKSLLKLQNHITGRKDFKMKLCKCGCGKTFEPWRNKKFFSKGCQVLYFRKKWTYEMKKIMKEEKTEYHQRKCLRCSEIKEVEIGFHFCDRCREINKQIIESHALEGALWGGRNSYDL